MGDDPPPIAGGASRPSDSRGPPSGGAGGNGSNDTTSTQAQAGVGGPPDDGGPLVVASVSESPGGLPEAGGFGGGDMNGAAGGGAASTAVDVRKSPSQNIVSAHQPSSDRAPRMHHPDLPFLVTHWISQYAPPPTAAAAAAATESGGIAAGDTLGDTSGGDLGMGDGARESSSSTSTTAAAGGGANDQRATSKADHKKREEALKAIRASAEALARAFQALGAFGASSSMFMGSAAAAAGDGPASYADVARRYGPLLAQGGLTLDDGDATGRGVTGGGRGGVDGSVGRGGSYGGRTSLLDALISSSSSARAAATRSEWNNRLPWSLVEAAREGSVPTHGEVEMAEGSRLGGGSGGSAGGAAGGAVGGTGAAAASGGHGTAAGTNPGAGRRVGEDAHNASLDHLVLTGDTLGSAMQPPVFLDGEETADPSSALRAAARASRRRLEMREEWAARRREAEGTLLAMEVARNGRNGGAAVGAAAGEGAASAGAAPNGGTIDLTGAPAGASGATNDEAGELDRQRVLAHLGNHLRELRRKQSQTEARLGEATAEAATSYELAVRQQGRGFRSNGERGAVARILRGNNAPGGHRPFGPSLPGRNPVGLDAVLARQYSRRGPSPTDPRLAVLHSRLSHAVTVSCHLIYPVYCLQFDRTGRYFVTGADDQVVKVFCLGAGPRKGGVGGGGFNYHANARGAVLVCTLRGHAGVVADIDVSANNALVATASMDGDRR